MRVVDIRQVAESDGSFFALTGDDNMSWQGIVNLPLPSYNDPLRFGLLLPTERPILALFRTTSGRIRLDMEVIF